MKVNQDHDKIISKVITKNIDKDKKKDIRTKIIKNNFNDNKIRKMKTKTKLVTANSDHDIVRKHVLQLCSFIKETTEICNDEFHLNEQNSNHESTTTTTIETNNKLFNDYSFCTLEANKFLTLNGITEDLFKTLSNKQNSINNLNFKKLRNILTDKRNTETSLINGITKENERGKEEEEDEETVQQKMKNKKEILERIRSKIFERRRLKMLSKKQMKVHHVWRPW